MMRRRTVVNVLATYYIVTGAWPLLHMRSFEVVTGRKTDHWLVRMVAALAVANGVALAVGGRRRVTSAETSTLAACSIVAFSAIDITYVLDGTIRPIYLADACLELALAVALYVSKND
jgi:hypothetical protein